VWLTSSHELDRLALDLAGGLDERLQLSVEELFLRADPRQTMTAESKRIQAV
jgi:hypothetical protein